MAIEDANSKEEFWTELVTLHHELGYQNIVVPMISVPQDFVIELAIKLKISLLTQRASYVFSTVQPATLVQMGERVATH